jgi:hypothetical protein
MWSGRAAGWWCFPIRGFLRRQTNAEIADALG